MTICMSPKTLNNETFQLFIEHTMKSEAGDAVTSPGISVSKSEFPLSRFCFQVLFAVSLG